MHFYRCTQNVVMRDIFFFFILHARLLFPFLELFAAKLRSMEDTSLVATIPLHVIRTIPLVNILSIMYVDHVTSLIRSAWFYKNYFSMNFVHINDIIISIHQSFD